MKTSHLNRFAGIIIALTVTAGSAVSSNNFDGRGRNRTNTTTCINQISGLSQDQKDQMTALRTEHQSVMNNLREQRRATTDIAQKDQIRKQMDTQVENHRNKVASLLNADQQKQYNQLNAGRGGNQQSGYSKGMGQGTGKGTGRGNGGRCRY